MQQKTEQNIHNDLAGSLAIYFEEVCTYQLLLGILNIEMQFML